MGPLEGGGMVTIPDCMMLPWPGPPDGDGEMPPELLECPITKPGAELDEDMSLDSPKSVSLKMSKEIKCKYLSSFEFS